MGKLYLTKVKTEINMLVGIGTKKDLAYIQETTFYQAKILFIHQKIEFSVLEN